MTRRPSRAVRHALALQQHGRDLDTAIEEIHAMLLAGAPFHQVAWRIRQVSLDSLALQRPWTWRWWRSW